MNFNNVIPTEDQEQASLVEWLELVGLRFTHVAVSTYTTSWNQKRKNHVLGLRKGFPDMVVLIPAHRSKDGVSRMLMLEMKRRKGGVLSPEQKEWIAALNALSSPNIEAIVCKGCQEGMDAINKYLKPEPSRSPF